MKVFGRVIILLISLLVILVGVTFLTGNQHLFKAISTTYLVGKSGPSIWDFKYFEHREVVKGPNTLYWQPADTEIELSDSFQSTLDNYNTQAFLVIQNGKIIFEQYNEPASRSSLTNSFSMAKSFTALAIGVALKEGLIQSVNDKVSKYLPRFNYPEAENLTIYHLLTMSSNINFDESYGNPIGYMAKVYYGNDIRKLSLPFKVIENPGTSFEYLGGNTLLLAEIIETVSGLNMSEFFSNYIYSNLGTEQSAYWTIDKKGVEKAYCCFYSSARDFAKVGQLLINQGWWNNQQLIDSTFMQDAVKPLVLNDGSTEDTYGYQIWLTEYEGHFVPFYRGILGQYVFTIPSLDAVVVRLGEGRSNEKVNGHPKDVFEYLEVAFSMLELDLE
ncbi:MAG: serine hydrolase domain-containing protein [Luteibaculaceae bacterium]